MNERARLMTALVFATVMGSLDSSFVPLTFSDIIVKLDTSTSVVVWVALGYLVTATGPMLFFARLGDRHGHANLFRLGSLVYAVSMALCGLAPNIGSLILFRCLQGLGMAAFLPATFALATRAYPPQERGKAVGILASANAFGFILGPLFAGFLLDSYDWRATFTSRIPLAILAVVMALVFVKKPASPEERSKATSLDLPGATWLTLGLFGLLYGLNRLPVESNIRDPFVWAGFLAGVWCLWWFVKHEQRTPDPLVNMELFRKHEAFAKASLSFAIMFASFPVYLFILPIILIAGLELRAFDAGLILGSVALVTFFVSPYAGKLSDRMGPERLCMLGAALVVLGYLSMLLIRVESGSGTLLVPMVLIGVGTGFYFSPNNAIIIGSVPPHLAGMASGLIGTFRQAGYAVGFALMANLFTLIQTVYEGDWMAQSLRPMPESFARQLSHLIEVGGLWSPEMLVFIGHVGAVTAAFLGVLSAMYSWRRVSLRGDDQALLLTATVLVFVLIGSSVAVASDLRLGTSMASFLDGGRRTADRVRAFGWAAKYPKPQPRARTGADVYAGFCASCHGANAEGLADAGPSLSASAFVNELSDRQLTEFLRLGRPENAPDSKRRRLMPGLGRTNGFRESDYPLVIEYLRSKTSGASAGPR
jgi:EmrB/QacA subfamily drug resistance transporter